jgi:hypothetical protein
VIAGLREIGEPARKAMIVDLTRRAFRARTVGLYYLLRGLSVSPAAAIGGMLWAVRPSRTFFAATVIGLVGAGTFAVTIRPEDAA